MWIARINLARKFGNHAQQIYSITKNVGHYCPTYIKRQLPILAEIRNTNISTHNCIKPHELGSHNWNTNCSVNYSDKAAAIIQIDVQS
jgi:hypothetical protein